MLTWEDALSSVWPSPLVIFLYFVLTHKTLGAFAVHACIRRCGKMPATLEGVARCCLHLRAW